jgi:hypothetical protein
MIHPLVLGKHYIMVGSQYMISHVSTRFTIRLLFKDVNFRKLSIALLFFATFKQFTIFTHMKNLLLIITIACLLTACEPVTTEARLNEAAKEFADATLHNKAEILLKYTHPKIVNNIGGLQKTAAAIKQDIEKSKNIVYEKVDFGPAGKMFTVGTELYTILPEKIVVRSTPKPALVSTSFLANSPDKGKTWYLTDVGSYDDSIIEELFPGVIGKINIPKYTYDQLK